MARVTVEDCIEKVTSRFELVMLAAQRARQIGSGSPLTIERDNDKNPVVSLREIADETVVLDDLKEELTRSHQRFIAMDDDEEDIIELMDGEQEWSTMSNEGAQTASGDEKPSDEGASGLEELAGGNL